MQFTIHTAKEYIESKLLTIYSKNEVFSIFKIILDTKFGISNTDIILNNQKELTNKETELFTQIVNDLTSHKPIQHILGETEFYGLKFFVNESTLIPRPETEELVEWILTDFESKNLNVLDIGTGSGCIPISLAKNMSSANVYSLDISERAITIAERNNKLNESKVSFILADILKDNPLSNLDFDIVVSNPPYIKLSEKELMKENVLNHEPHLALFVDDDEPLIFYDKISKYAFSRLKSGGKLYFEINEALGEETVECLKSYGFENIVLRKDINGKDRMVRADKL